MKRIIFITLGATVALTCSAQKLKEKEVPANLKETFSRSYPAAKEIKWEKEGAYFEAEFEVGDIEQSVLFDAAGSILETEVQISEAELPAPAREYIASNHKGMKIKEAAKITASTGAMTYEAEVDKKDLIFDASGKFLKAEEETGGGNND